jgi:superfamily II DNA or RNA helicase
MKRSTKSEKTPAPKLSEEYKKSICEIAYLGKQGYTVPKSALTNEDLEFLKKDLFLKPEIQGAGMYGGPATDTAFPVYRESDKKIYIPRFYGVERYGEPHKSEIEAGMDIAVPFVKPLRDYQENIIDIYLNRVRADKPSGGILQIYTGAGKCLARDTAIRMADDSVIKVQDIRVGDHIMGDDFKPRTILSLARGTDQMYEICENRTIREICENRTIRKYIVNSEHILSLKMKHLEFIYYYGDTIIIYEYDETDDTVIIDICLKDYLKITDVAQLTKMFGYRRIRPSPQNNNYIRPSIYSITVKESYVGSYYGFEIDGNRRFLLGDYTVTHNTVMALKIAATLSKKTMILVHKEFLMNQWIERILEFMPSARVGKIKGTILDIENKDIVLAMIQTMYNRTFTQDVYSQFGLTIIDEVHRIGSEEFSRTLLKTITPYMLGISATVERKDKLTKLLHMFIGPMIYSTERKKDEIVDVRGIEFKTNDTEFNETETDYRGKPKYSTMISKLCDYGPRRDFILKVIVDLKKENPDAQMLVLGNNRSLLNALYESVTNRGIEVGRYLGGMKQENLKKSETKQVLLGTYSMAQEALDIKNLSILVLATPKTDIVQCVGRILRMKHEKPIIIDIVDSHSLFQNQWTQRKRYYKKCNYSIKYTTSDKYKGFTAEHWETEWLRVYEPKIVTTTILGKICKTATKDGEKEEEEENAVTIFGGKCKLDVNELFGGGSKG